MSAAVQDRLRVVVCGSVDDGKSTLLGRLLHDAGALTDQEREGLVDFAALLDGLEAEREQGVTIDVAWRFFSTPRRAFVIADVPGHSQYTRNMVTGASTADVGLVLVDARKGVLLQTRRHLYVLALLGVRSVVFAVNKIDLIDGDRGRFETLVADLSAVAQECGVPDAAMVPVSAAQGDNVVRRGALTPWYDGPTLLELLEHLPPPQDQLADASFRMWVQSVVRADPDFRGLCGLVASGTVSPGDAVVALPSGRTSRVERIVARGGDLDLAAAGQSVTLTLCDPLDVGRGDLLATADDPAPTADQFEADLVWMGDQPMLPGRTYLLKCGARTIPAQVSEIRHVVDVTTLNRLAARTLELNDIAVCHIACDAPIPFQAYADNRDLGGFILIDRETAATVGAGMIRFALRRSRNVRWQTLVVDKAARAALNAQQPAVVWFTGLSGAGKSTIADLVERRLHALGRRTYLLDGDNLRHGLNRDLGFTPADRVENVRRAAEVARLMTDAGLIVLAAFISPFAAERRMARELMGDGEFLEVFVDAPLATVEARDPKGLYALSRAGRLPNFTGVDSPYEVPEAPDLRIDTETLDPDGAADLVIDALRRRGHID